MRGLLRDYGAWCEGCLKRVLIKRLLQPLYLTASFFIALVGLVFAPPFRLIRRSFNKQFNSLWAGTPILTLPLKARAEAMLGVNAKSLVYVSYGIAKGGFDIHLGRWVCIPVLGRLVPLLTFLYACVTQDRLHFFCDRGLLPVHKLFEINWFELAVYRLLGIQMFFWVYGADVRTRNATLRLGEPNCCTFCPAVGSACACTDERGRRNYEVISHYATAVFSMGDMIHYTPGSRNDVFFWPIDLAAEQGAKYAPVYPDALSQKPIRIVHAANHRAFKGTDFLVSAVEELAAEGVLIELVLVEKMPNEIALALYRSADIIFDQCLIGFHGYFALEGMALGKPVMSFVRSPQEYLLAPNECPIINTSLKTLKRDIAELCRDRDRLHDLGARGRQYIEKYYTVAAVSQRMASAYRDIGV